MCVCSCSAGAPHLFVRMVVGIYVVVKLLMSQVLFLTQLTVEKSLQILY